MDFTEVGKSQLRGERLDLGFANGADVELEGAMGHDEPGKREITQSEGVSRL